MTAKQHTAHPKTNGVKKKKEQSLPEVFSCDGTGRMTDGTYTVRVEDKEIHPTGAVRTAFMKVFPIIVTLLPFRVHGKVGSRNMSWRHSAEKRTTSVTTETRKTDTISIINDVFVVPCVKPWRKNSAEPERNIISQM